MSSPVALSKVKPMSLTPESRSAETTNEAMVEGAINGVLTLIPTVGALAVALKKYPKFASRTNWQSRTALAIMPALFMATLTSEQKLVEKMKEVAAETEHTHSAVKWAEEQLQQQQNTAAYAAGGAEQHLRSLYHQSVLARDENVCVIPGSSLAWHYRTANYIAANPIKVLASLAVPSVAWIYYGNSGKEHLEFSHKLLHTRVFGQFATITCLLGVMSFKDFMDKNGRFISQADADARVEEMKQVRLQLISRLQAEHEHEEQWKREIQEAHDADIREHRIPKQNKASKKKPSAVSHDFAAAVSPVGDAA